MTAPQKSRRRARLDIRTEVRGRELTGEEAARIRLEASYGVAAAALLERLEMDAGRPVDAPDAEWLRRIMRAVEARIVEAIWTLIRLPTSRGPGWAQRHGVDYLVEFSEAYGNAVANDGKWEAPPLHPPLPSAKAIDAMWEPLEWLRSRDAGGFLDMERCRLLWAAAATKRGEIDRNVAWRVVVELVPDLRVLAVRTLQRRYEDGLRAIVAELLARG